MVVLLVFFMGLGALAQRLTVLNIQQHRSYVDRSLQHTQASVAVGAPRGRIYDRKGHLWVTNEPQFDLVADLRDWRTMETDRAWLEPMLKQPLQTLLEERQSSSVRLLRGLTAKQLAELTPRVAHIQGLDIESSSYRRYPHGPLGAHMMGTVGPIIDSELEKLEGQDYSFRDDIGKTGLERTFESYLRGRKGQELLRLDAAGKILERTMQRRPIRGSDLHLTLDLSLQLEAEKALREKLLEIKERNGERAYGSVVAMEAKTGRVLAMVSLPQFDPRVFARGIRPSEYAALLKDRGTPLLHRAVSGSLSPGSTFKLVTGSAALDQKLCNTGSYFVCGGSYLGANCFVTSGHGGINFEDSLAHSCDVVYYSLGDRMGIGNLRRYCARFGLGDKSGIELFEEDPGLLPSPKWKQKVIGEEWYRGDTVNHSIGQGFLLVTPLQMAVVTAAVANGGKVLKPYLVESAVSARGKETYRATPGQGHSLEIDDRYLAAVRRGMRGAVTHGTSVSANSSLTQVAGKTGTVENSPSASNHHGRNHTWFVSFAPYNDPELVVVCALEQSGGYGGSQAAPVVRKVIDHYFGVLK